MFNVLPPTELLDALPFVGSHAANLPSMKTLKTRLLSVCFLSVAIFVT